MILKKIRLLNIDLWIDYGNQINNFFMFLRQIFKIKISKAKSAWFDKCIYFGYFANYQNNNFTFLSETQRLNYFIESNGVKIINTPNEIMHDNYMENNVLLKNKEFIVISLGSAQPHLNFWHENKFIELVK